MERIKLPPFAPTDWIVTFAFTSGPDYEPYSCVMDDTAAFDVVGPASSAGPSGEQLSFVDGSRYGVKCAERTDVVALIGQLLSASHVTYAVTREVCERSKTVRKTYFDIETGVAKTDKDRELNAELVRFAGRSLWAAEVYRNPRKDLPGKTGLHIRCFSRSEYRNAAGEVPMVWPRNAQGNPIKDGEKVPTEPTFILELAATAKKVAATPTTTTAGAAA